METEIRKNGKVYLHNTNDGYYGVKVEPGSTEDNTSGKTGIHWEYLQYAKSSPIVDELRTLIPAFRELEIQPKKEISAIPPVSPGINEPCSKCGTYCYGDCEVF